MFSNRWMRFSISMVNMDLPVTFQIYSFAIYLLEPASWIQVSCISSFTLASLITPRTRAFRRPENLKREQRRWSEARWEPLHSCFKACDAVTSTYLTKGGRTAVSYSFGVLSVGSFRIWVWGLSIMLPSYLTCFQATFGNLEYFGYVLGIYSLTFK